MTMNLMKRIWLLQNKSIYHCCTSNIHTTWLFQSIREICDMKIIQIGTYLALSSLLYIIFRIQFIDLLMVGLQLHHNPTVTAFQFVLSNIGWSLFALLETILVRYMHSFSIKLSCPCWILCTTDWITPWGVAETDMTIASDRQFKVPATFVIIAEPSPLDSCAEDFMLDFMLDLALEWCFDFDDAIGSPSSESQADCFCLPFEVWEGTEGGDIAGVSEVKWDREGLGKVFVNKEGILMSICIGILLLLLLPSSLSRLSPSSESPLPSMAASTAVSTVSGVVTAIAAVWTNVPVALDFAIILSIFEM